VWVQSSVLCCHAVDVFAVDAWTIAFSSDSRFIASGSHTGKIILYGVESGSSEVQLDTRGGKFALSIAYVSHCLILTANTQHIVSPVSDDR